MEMRAVRHAYVTSAGVFLPGDPVDNETMESRLGIAGSEPSRYRERILKHNGIETRHYALDAEGRQTHLNEELAAEAVRRALRGRGLEPASLGMLALGTTIPDVLMPGFASMVHGRLGGGPAECLSSAGVCCSAIGALRAAVNAVRVGDHEVAVAGGSELASQMMKGKRFDGESELAPARENTAASFQYFNADFLRWMLSDGAGAVVIEPRPRPDGLSLRVDWLDMVSYAHAYDTCMYLGLSDSQNPSVGKTFLSYDSMADAERAGLLVVRQDTKLLGSVIPEVLCDGARRAVQAGKLVGAEIDWFLPHISSYFFKDVVAKAMRDAGAPIPDERWFTNLKKCGNTGSASFYVMLEEALRSGMLKPGQKVLAMIPESGRFTVAYAQFTVVGAER
jgi:3-oxoacyl-[acyl-carrier-protein] synthase III